MFKKIFYLLLIVAAGLTIWVAFAIWAGIYSVYSYPPGDDYPDGATLLVSRDPGEPMWNSPDVPKPKKKPQPRPGSGIGFSAPEKPRRPVAKRIIAELPYIEWAYKQSLEAKPEE